MTLNEPKWEVSCVCVCVCEGPYSSVTLKKYLVVCTKAFCVVLCSLECPKDNLKDNNAYSEGMLLL